MAVTLTTIDVSKHQDSDDIDWSSYINRGLKSVIIQLSHGNQYEPKAKEFIEKAKSYKLQVHGYHFYQGDPNEIMFSVNNAKKLGLPEGAYMFLDMEGSISGDWQSIFYSFRSAWLQSGWHAGLYVSDSPYRTKFNNTKLVNDGVYRWIASYSYEPQNYDIWQYGTSNGKLDTSYDRTGALGKAYVTHGDNIPDPQPGTFYPGPRNPVKPTGNSWVGWGVDSSGLGGGTTLGYSTDGRNFYAALWPGGFVFRQNDADQMWTLLKDKISAVKSGSFSVKWTDILNKPDLVTKNELESKLADIKNDLPSINSLAKQADLIKVQALAQSAKSISEENAESLTNKADKDDIPNSWDWNKIINKPDVATRADLENIKMTSGKDGKSAYQIAVDHGFVGSEEEWIQSLHGKDGRNGGGTSGGDNTLSIEAITALIKQHIKAGVDTKNGQLTMTVDSTSDGSIADAVAAKVATSLTWKLTSDGNLIAEGGA